ncbi:hypothetical protein D3C75_561500 [compost metagenome]
MGIDLALESLKLQFLHKTLHFQALFIPFNENAEVSRHMLDRIREDAEFVIPAWLWADVQISCSDLLGQTDQSADRPRNAARGPDREQHPHKRIHPEQRRAQPVHPVVLFPDILDDRPVKCQLCIHHPLTFLTDVTGDLLSFRIMLKGDLRVFRGGSPDGGLLLFKKAGGQTNIILQCERNASLPALLSDFTTQPLQLAACSVHLRLIYSRIEQKGIHKLKISIGPFGALLDKKNPAQHFIVTSLNNLSTLEHKKSDGVGQHHKEGDANQQLGSNRHSAPPPASGSRDSFLIT